MVYRVGAPRFHELTAAQARQSFRKLQAAFGPALSPVACAQDLALPRLDGSALGARLYRPIDSCDEDTLPLLIYFHGGGWCVGDVVSHDGLCRELSNRSGWAVLSVDYRLAPEHPFPAAVEDAIFSVEWAAEHAAGLRVDPARIAVGGDSAGGNLSIVSALLAHERGSVRLGFMLLVYPSTEIGGNRASEQEFGQGYMLDRESLEWFYTRYLPHGTGGDWRAAPMLAPSLGALPPCLLITAECDPLTDSCVAFARRLEQEGGQVEHLAVGGVVHGFITLGKIFPEAELAIDHAARTLRNLG